MEVVSNVVLKKLQDAKGNLPKREGDFTPRAMDAWKALESAASKCGFILLVVFNVNTWSLFYFCFWVSLTFNSSFQKNSAKKQKAKIWNFKVFAAAHHLFSLKVEKKLKPWFFACLSTEIKKHRQDTLTEALKGDEVLAEMLMHAKLIVQTRKRDVRGNKPQYDWYFVGYAKQMLNMKK